MPSSVNPSTAEATKGIRRIAVASPQIQMRPGVERVQKFFATSADLSTSGGAGSSIERVCGQSPRAEVASMGAPV